MSSGPITSWQIEGEKVEAVTDFLFLGFKITADGDCSHEIRSCLLLGRKAMTNLDSILKSRDIILLTKVHLVKAMVFPVVMYGCESWTIKKVELSCLYFNTNRKRYMVVSCACMFSHFSCVQFFATLWTVVHLAPLSMGVSRQKYWSELS